VGDAVAADAPVLLMLLAGGWLAFSMATAGPLKRLLFNTPIAAALAAPARDHLGHIGPRALSVNAHSIAQQVILLQTHKNAVLMSALLRAATDAWHRKVFYCQTMVQIQCWLALSAAVLPKKASEIIIKA
jgi:hypothetical protein